MSQQLTTNEAKIEAIRKGTYSIDQFIVENEGMIKSAILRHTQGGFLLHHQWDELLNIARYGFYKAVIDFEPELGFRFTTLAYKVMSYEIKNYFHRDIVVSNQQAMKQREFDERLHDRGFEIDMLTQNINTEGISLTKRQKELYEAYLTHQNFEVVGELYGLKKQTVHESIKKSQAKMREKYYYLLAC